MKKSANVSTFIKGFTMNKIFGGHVGDRTFDAFDWLPLIAVLVGAALLLSGLFPNTFNVLGSNSLGIAIGRDGRVEEDETVLDQALTHLESGIMMLSAIRHEDGCSQRLACHLGTNLYSMTLFDIGYL